MAGGDRGVALGNWAAPGGDLPNVGRVVREELVGGGGEGGSRRSGDRWTGTCGSPSRSCFKEEMVCLDGEF